MGRSEEILVVESCESGGKSCLIELQNGGKSFSTAVARVRRTKFSELAYSCKCEKEEDVLTGLRGPFCGADGLLGKREYQTGCMEVVSGCCINYLRQTVSCTLFLHRFSPGCFTQC